MLLYSLETLKKVPIMGKHTKSIISGAWTTGDVVALGSEDQTVT